MATINLAPGAQYLAIVQRRRRLLFSLSVFIAAAVIVALVTIALATRSTEQTLQRTESQLRSIETQIAQLHDDVERINAFEARLLALESLVKNHVSWTPFYKELERLLPAPIALTQMKANIPQTEVELEAGGPDMEQVAQTLASLGTSAGRPTMFKSAELINILRKEATPDGQPGSYIFNAKLIFDKKSLQTNNLDGR